MLLPLITMLFATSPHTAINITNMPAQCTTCQSASIAIAIAILITATISPPSPTTILYISTHASSHLCRVPAPNILLPPCNRPCGCCHCQMTPQPLSSSDPEPVEYLFYPTGHCLGCPIASMSCCAHCPPTLYPAVNSDSSVSHVPETLGMGGTPTYP